MPPTALTSPRLSRPQLLGLIVLLATLVAFYNSLDGAFLFDDLDAIHNNASIQSLWPPWRALQPPRETSVAGRPLVNLSLAINYAIHGISPRGYHLVNLAIHAAAALTLFGLIRRLLRAQTLGARFDADADLLAALVAVLWAVHPLQTESVTYIVQRAESLCGLAYLLTLYTFTRSMTAARPAAWRLASVLSCFAGMACKEVMVTAPLMVLLIDRAHYAPSFRGAFASRRGFYIGLFASWCVLGWLLAGSPRPESAGAALPFGPIAYLRTQAEVILHYLRMSFWPDPLILDYNWPISSSWRDSAIQITVMAALLALTLVVWFRSPAAALPAVAFFLLLSPTSSVYPILDAAFEHRMYLPLAPIVLLVVLALRWLLMRALVNRPTSVAATLSSLCAIATAALTVRTLQRNTEYADPVTLWRANLRDGGLENPRAWTNLSGAFMETGQYAEARDAALYGIRLSSNNVEAYTNLCAAALQLGRTDESVQMGQNAVSIRPHSVEARVNLGLALKAAGRLDEARREFETALAIRPDCVPAQVALDQLSIPAGGTAVGPPETGPQPKLTP